MKTYTLKIKCLSGANYENYFERTIEVPEEMTLGELHDFIQRLTGFDNDHIFTFYLGRNPRGKKVNILESSINWDNEAEEFYNYPLSRLFPLPKNMKLYYFFDFGDSWTFQISILLTIKEHDKNVEYPIIIKEVGPKPTQYPDYD